MFPTAAAASRLTPSLLTRGGIITSGVEAGYEILTYKVGHPSGPFTWLGQKAADYFYPLDTGNTDPAPVAQGATRNSNRIKADPRAGSAPHTVFRRDPATGRIDHYESYKTADPRDPNLVKPYKRFDGVGDLHRDPQRGNVPTPHINYRDNKGNSRARPVRNNEKPKGY
jgi:hypothetical protein